MTTYDPKHGVQDAAADAMIDAIALYKAAGYTAQMGADNFEMLWAAVDAAKPETAQPK